MNKKSNNEYTLLEYILTSLVPYTKPNRDLVFRRDRFVKQISKLSGSSINSVGATITRAKKVGYLESIEEKNKENLMLTTKGSIKILKLLLSDKKEKWDESWRILIFDIPERKRKTRDAFRKILAEMGFKKYQISVWICPYDRTNELEMIIDEFNLKPYIQYFISKSVSDEEKLKKMFELD
jgi:phenylacetic acid degradation operon negative regulatory protein